MHNVCHLVATQDGFLALAFKTVQLFKPSWLVEKAMATAKTKVLLLKPQIKIIIIAKTFTCYQNAAVEQIEEQMDSKDEFFCMGIEKKSSSLMILPTLMQISTAMDRHALLDDDMRPLDVKQHSAGSDLQSAVEEAATRGLQFTAVAVDLFDHGCQKQAVSPNAWNKGAVALSSMSGLVERNHVGDHTVGALVC